MPLNQRLVTRLWPIGRLDVEPDFPRGNVLLGPDIGLNISALAGYNGDNLVLADITSAGAIHVADTGSGLESYEVFSGYATDSATALSVSAPSSGVKLFITDFPIDIAFQDSSLTWGSDIELPLGQYDWEFTFTDIRINNQTAGLNSSYLITTFN